MDEKPARDEDLVQLARLAVGGSQRDVATFLRRVARRERVDNPDLAAAINGVLRDAPTRSSPLRRESPTAVPTDADSRLDLVRTEHPDPSELSLILPESLRRELGQLVAEREMPERLEAADLEPSRTVLFVGPPGVGKTLAARFVAAELGLPLLVLDLSSVMSSMLGRTGANIRQVIDFARNKQCVLLLDELDAIAKRRHDDLDIGELKRLVTVLLQQIDDWPADAGLIVGATNHPELLDPAVWRRFDVVVEFPLPDDDARREAVALFSGGPLSAGLLELATYSMRGMSFSDVERQLARARRVAALSDESVEEVLLNSLSDRIRGLSLEERRTIGVGLVANGFASQRKASEITGLSRDTLRKSGALRSEEMTHA